MPSWIVSFPDRLDAFLAADNRMLSRAKAQKAIEEGLVSVNDDVVTKPAFRVQEGDKVGLNEDAGRKPAPSILEPVDLHLNVLYEDVACLIIDKPAGVAVHPGAGMMPNEVTILSGIAHVFHGRSLPFSPEAVLVHRLDKETTGCLLIAKTSEAHRALQEQFETRTVRKLYLAIVAGVPRLPTATVDAPIGRSTRDRTTMAVSGSFSSREAQTTYRILSSDAARKAALVECDLHTGRTHQVRVHLHSIGHPVLGDETYTNTLSERLSQDFDIRNLCLHAWKLEFVSPSNGERHSVSAPVPTGFLSVLERLGIAWDE